MKKTFFLFLFLLLYGFAFGAINQVHYYEIPNKCPESLNPGDYEVRLEFSTSSGVIIDTTFRTGIGLADHLPFGIYLSVDLSQYSAIGFGDLIRVRLVPLNCKETRLVYHGEYFVGQQTCSGSNYFRGIHGLQATPFLDIPDISICAQELSQITAYIHNPSCDNVIDWGHPGIRTVLQVDDYVMGEIRGEVVEGSYKAFLYDGCGKVLDSCNYNLTIVPPPELEVDDTCRILGLGTEYDLSIIAPDTVGNIYIWKKEIRTEDGWEGLEESYGTSVSGAMGSSDIRYGVTATDKVNQCTTEKYVYLYNTSLEIPVIDIDTNHNKQSIRVHWSPPPGSTGYTLKHILWDGYAVLGNYEEVEGFNGMDNFYILDNLTDTLEFFYVTARREACGQESQSLASDTVGYMRQTLYKNSPKLSQQNYIAYPFDMSSKNILTKVDLMKYIGKNEVGNYVVNTMSHFNETWKIATLLPTGTVFGENIDLKLGSVYRVNLTYDIRVEFVLFGKLPSKFTYNLEANKENYILTPLTFGYKTDRMNVGNTINGINTVSSYVFIDQSWGISSKVGTNWYGTTGDVIINVWRPLRVITTLPLNWKY